MTGKIAGAILCLIMAASAKGQDADTYYKRALDAIDADRMEEAAVLFGKTIELQPENFYAWFNRGIARIELRQFDEALSDFDQTVALGPKYKKGYLQRGTVKRRLADYEGALTDYNFVLQLDPAFTDAYFNRGLVYEMLGQKDAACADYKRARELGMNGASRKAEACDEVADDSVPINPILRLTRHATDKEYGFTEANPVMAGTGPEGGPANQRIYLDLLRDAQGKPIHYERIGSCCHYESQNGLFGLGMGMLDKYTIRYQDENGKDQTAVVYISFYDYEDPLILYGFKTVGE